jgi:hypothetical protein
MRQLGWALAACAAFGAGCGDSGDDGTAPAGDVGAVPLAGKTVYFASSGSEILNPERGFHKWVNLVDGTDFSSVRAAGYTLGFASVSLASYRSSSLSSSFLDRLVRGFNAARTAGIKLILRFKYSDGFDDPDASKSRMLQHIGQLAPLLQAHADVIAVMQAGFIGAWGEWHSSTNGLDNPADEREILTALLDALPSSRMIQVRTPTHKQSIYGTEPVSSSEAFSGSDRSRVGHHNDALLSSSTDQGTYKSSQVELQKAYVSQEGRFVAVGGECNTYRPPYTDADNAMAEMRRLHFTFLSSSYLRRVLDGWAAEGKLDDIQRDLGYRIELLKSSWPDIVRPGEEFALLVRLQNVGYAAPFNPRPFYVVLDGAAGRRIALIPDLDWRTFAPGQVVERTLRLRTSSGLPTGTYRLSLWMPDAASTLRDRPEYAVLFATSGVRDAAAGLNRLTDAFVVSGSAGTYSSGVITLR